MVAGMISSARSWLPFILHPHRSLRNFAECWSSYDPQTWQGPIDLVDSGIKLGLDMLIPALLLSLIGSIIISSPSSSLGGAINNAELTSSLSPYTSHSMALSSRVPTLSATSHPLLQSIDLSYLIRLLALSIISPITVDIIFNHFAPVMSLAMARLKVVLSSHKGADANTKAALLESVRSGRVIRRQQYDLYLPPKDTINAQEIKSLLFFPGFGLHHSAYADVASRLSDEGITVAVVILSPLRLAHETLGGSIDDVKRLIKSAGNDVVKHCKRMCKGNEGTINIEWAIGGHSMGGYCTFQLAADLTNQELPSMKLNDGSITRVSPNFVVWAAGPSDMADLDPNLQKSESSLLVLLGGSDNIAKFTSQQQKRQFMLQLPRNSRLVTIKGGNHSGFASYDEDSKKSDSYLMNGQREISLDAQHKEAARHTASFLMGK